MSSWGTGIKQDDLVGDVIACFDERLKDGASLEEPTRAVITEFSEALEDQDEGPRVWIAIAEAQWSYGGLAKEILDRMKHDFENGKGLALP